MIQEFYEDPQKLFASGQSSPLIVRLVLVHSQSTLWRSVNDLLYSSYKWVFTTYIYLMAQRQLRSRAARGSFHGPGVHRIYCKRHLCGVPTTFQFPLKVYFFGSNLKNCTNLTEAQKFLDHFAYFGLIIFCMPKGLTRTHF
jgi:hypothetical protein